MDTTTIAVDIAKSVFQVAVCRRTGHVCENHRLSRAKFKPFFAQQQPATVLMEACSSAHHWARQLKALGHFVILLPPHAVRPYVPRNKNDRTDAKALLEAFRNKDIHPVPVKSVDQHVMMTLHRYRSAYMAQRIARINATRGVLREIGIFIPLGAARLVPAVYDLTGDPDSAVPRSLRPILNEAGAEITDLKVRIHEIEHQLLSLAKDDPLISHLRTIPGIGLLSATALIAHVGDITRFPTGRHFASYLGLTPREHSSGLRRLLGRIFKRGDSYIRMLLIHAAQSVLWASKRSKNPDRIRSWALEIERSRGHNKAAVALANKLARIVWAVWINNHRFESIKEVG
ncbi:MAG: IS110 family transposase [Dehalococcoidia bacterium]|nr:IS110 family transposase [Dehalococcoidia bacterium]